MFIVYGRTTVEKVCDDKHVTERTTGGCNCPPAVNVSVSYTHPYNLGGHSSSLTLSLVMRHRMSPILIWTSLKGGPGMDINSAWIINHD